MNADLPALTAAHDDGLSWGTYRHPTNFFIEFAESMLLWTRFSLNGGQVR
jgi:hypothetical protein